jgi:hypothetical protein
MQTQPRRHGEEEKKRNVAASSGGRESNAHFHGRPCNQSKALTVLLNGRLEDQKPRFLLRMPAVAPDPKRSTRDDEEDRQER